jgi:pSer/pThr/pTyr-binding forkhead associated (FHA) protein
MIHLFAAGAGFERQMRLATLEITAALLAVAVLAGRPRTRATAEIAEQTPMHVELDILERGARRSAALASPFEVGRTDEADVVLRDPEVSRRHARFEGHDGVLYVEDLKSSNGTFLNGRRLREAVEVRAGDEIDVGTTRLTVTSVRRS